MVPFPLLALMPADVCSLAHPRLKVLFVTLGAGQFFVIGRNGLSQSPPEFLSTYNNQKSEEMTICHDVVSAQA